MDLAERNEARIVTTDNVLVVLSASVDDPRTIEDFCGSVVTARDLAAGRPDFSGKTVYLCGDLSRASDLQLELEAAARVFVVADLSRNEADGVAWPTLHSGRVPVLVHGVGVLYRRFFEPGLDGFDRIRAEHAFQRLTESTKPGQAHRTGIYLTPVERIGRELRFRLLRCSTNLSGPTENFRATDRHIVDALNQEAACIFRGQAPLNHVLAQLYPNTAATDAQRQIKARIKAHADKTKDMPDNGIMAFCTFYDRLDALAPLPEDPFDRGHGKTSGLTRLIFRLKSPVAERPGCTLPVQFTVTLYPNSVFFVPLSTNRCYTHEISPSMSDAAKIPTRLGYVVRCSATEAVHADGHTFIEGRRGRQALQPPTPEGTAALRALYAEENRTDALIDYADRFLFSAIRSGRLHLGCWWSSQRSPAAARSRSPSSTAASWSSPSTPTAGSGTRSCSRTPPARRRTSGWVSPFERPGPLFTFATRRRTWRTARRSGWPTTTRAGRSTGCGVARIGSRASSGPRCPAPRARAT